MTLDYQLGCQLPTEAWIQLNRSLVFSDPSLAQFVSPFPPQELMLMFPDWITTRILPATARIFTLPCHRPRRNL